MLYSTAVITLSATLCGYAAAADTTRPTNHPLEVVSDIFLKQDDTGAANEAHYYSIIEAATRLGNYPGRFRGQAHLSASFVRDLQTKMGIAFSPFGGGDGGFQRGRIVSTTTMTASSPQHVDHYPAGTDGKRRSVDQDRVAFVVLNTNPDAYFVHGDVSVPIVEGSLVHFIGGILHNTIVNSGSVQLLGPFDAKRFTSVGLPPTQSPSPTETSSGSTPSGFPSPTETPTETPSGSPTQRPTSKSGKGSKVSKGFESVSASEPEGLVGSDFDGMSYGQVFSNDMSIGQIDEEESSSFSF